MAPVPRTTIDHFLHKGHPLIELHAETEYHCDGCKTLGDGARYRCNSCDFDLHKYCGTCPAILPSFMHIHSLNLVVRKPQGTCLLDRFCDVCGGAVLGLFYRCKNCDFDVHPLCSQLPQHLRHALHQLHPLRLQEPFFGFSRCAVCGGACTRWCYGCGPCGFALHLECVLVALPPPQPPPPAHWAVQHSHGITYPYVNQGQGGGAMGERNGNTVSGLVTKLALGVLSNMVFGVPGMDFSSFL